MFHFDESLALEDISSINNFGFGLFSMNSDGKILCINHKMLGYLNCRTLRELSARKNEEAIIRFFDTKKYFSASNYSRKKFHLNSKLEMNGSHQKIFREMVSLKVSAENKLIVDSVVEEITNEPVTENIIEDIFTRNYSILRLFPDFIFIVSKEGKFTEAKNSNAKKKMFPGEIIGKSVSEFFSPEIAERIQSSILETCESGDIKTIEFEKQIMGEPTYYEARFSLLSDREVIMVMRDITSSKLNEKKINCITEALHQSNQTKDKFLSIIGHDMRTPLNGLIGYADILRDEIEELSHAEIKEYASFIVEISRSTVTMLNNLLDWARVQSGKINFMPDELELNYIIQRILKLLSAAADNKNISLINNIPDNFIIYADENMINSILLNLINNSIKFTDEGGFVKITGERSNKFCRITVEDNGRGINETNKQNLFSSGKIISTKGTAKESGTGLGLLLCKDFTEKHGGRLKIESELNKGTRISFEIPIFEHCSNLQ